MKSVALSAEGGGYGRSPHGERGLKSNMPRIPSNMPWSLPTRGAWIEIPVLRRGGLQLWSLPTRGAWIEIDSSLDLPGLARRVAPHTGSVD